MERPEEPAEVGGEAAYYFGEAADTLVFYPLAFLGTWSLVIPALGNRSLYVPEQFPEVFPFVVGYFLLFSTATFLFKIVRGAKADLFDLLALFLNAGVFFAVARRMVGGKSS